MAYEITININGLSTNNAENGVSSSSTVGEQSLIEKNTKNLAKYISAQTIEPFINQAINFTTSNVELVTGSTELQQKTDLIMKGISTGINAFKNAQAGAVIATSLGTSAAIGGIVGIALTVLNEGINILFKKAQLDSKYQEENRQNQYLIDRAGPAFANSRRGI